MFLAKFSEKSATKILETLNDESKYDNLDRYPTSKLFDFLLCRETAKLPQAQGVVVKYALKHEQLETLLSVSFFF
jgi:hypothetical protein